MGHAVTLAFPVRGRPQGRCIPLRRASLIRNKLQVLGEVEAGNREATEAAAVRTFNLSPEQRSRLVTQERG